MVLNVALVTTWKQRCGIADYSANLAVALSNRDVNVFIVRIPRFGRKLDDLWRSIAESIPMSQIDLIHVQHEYGLWQGKEQTFFGILKNLGKPVVTTLHTTGSWQTDRLISSCSDKMIVHNEFCFRRLGHPKKTVAIPHGATVINEPPPPKTECKKSLGLQPKAPIVGHLGFISELKGLETLVDAMTKVPKAGLLICGGWFTEKETDYILKLKEYAYTKLPNRVTFYGYVKNEDLSRVYGGMDVFGYTPLFATESGALLMALSHGKATVTSKLSPFKEKEKLGALVTAKGATNIARKIRYLLENELARTSQEQKAKEYVETVSWPEIARRTVSLYDKVILDYAVAHAKKT